MHAAGADQSGADQSGADQSGADQSGVNQWWLAMVSINGGSQWWLAPPIAAVDSCLNSSGAS